MVEHIQLSQQNILHIKKRKKAYALEKAFDKIQYSFMMKNAQQNWNERNCLNVVSH